MFTLNDGILIAIAMIALMVGTATGSAYAMLGMAVVGLVLSAILYRGNLKHRGSLIVLTAVVAAFAVGYVLSVQ